MAWSEAKSSSSESSERWMAARWGCVTHQFEHHVGILLTEPRPAQQLLTRPEDGRLDRLLEPVRVLLCQVL
jgi:hypothetical protein